MFLLKPEPGGSKYWFINLLIDLRFGISKHNMKEGYILGQKVHLNHLCLSSGCIILEILQLSKAQFSSL